MAQSVALIEGISKALNFQINFKYFELENFFSSRNGQNLGSFHQKWKMTLLQLGQLGTKVWVG